MYHLEIANTLDRQRQTIVEQTADALIADPFFADRLKQTSRDRVLTDMESNFFALVKAVRYRSPMMMDDHVAWRRKMLLELNCSTGIVRQGYAHLWSAISATIAQDMLPTIQPYFISGMQTLAYTNAAARELTAAHELIAMDLVAATYDSHWHWQFAYQADGRPRALYDAWWTLDYLIDSLGTGNPDILGGQIRWMRQRNMARGLASAHMQQLLWLLSEATDQRLTPAAAADVRRILDRCAPFLTYDHEGCRALLSWQDTIVSEVAGRLVAQGLEPHPDIAAMEVGWEMSYLSDAIALGNSTALVSYSRWRQQWLASQGLPDTPLRQGLAALSEGIERHLPQYVVQDASALLRAAQHAL